VLYPLTYLESLRFRHSLAALLIALLGFNTAVRAAYWGDLAEHGLMEVKHHPGSPRANYQLGRVYWMMMKGDPKNNEKYYGLAHHHFEHAAFLQSNDTSNLIALICLNHLVDKPIESEWVALLKQRLQYAPFSPSSVSALVSLSKCQMDERYTLPQGEMEAIFQAAIRNPTVSSANRATLLSFAATNSLIMRDFVRALDLARQAVEANPDDKQLRQNLSNLTIALEKASTRQEQHIEHNQVAK
jgi:hypothetical protein